MKTSKILLLIILGLYLQSKAQTPFMVKSINAGNKDASPIYLTDVNGTLFFHAFDGSSTFGLLWKSDGTSAGTKLAKTLSVGAPGSVPNNLRRVNNILFYVSNVVTNQYPLWKSNGTETGTVMVKQTNPSANCNISNLTDVNGTLYFTADDNTHGNELWKSDGTAIGTIMVSDIVTGTVASGITSIANVNGTAFFNKGITNGELWKSNGTAAGTVLVKNYGTGFSSATASNLTNVNGTLYFTTSSWASSNSRKLWKSDGTDAGTTLIRSIATGSTGAGIKSLTYANNTLFFVVEDGGTTNGTELWKTDGTNAGTVMVKDINVGTASSNPSELISYNGMLYFTANDGINGTELWRSDGSEAGTLVVKDIYTGGSSNPSSLAVMRDILYFSANDGVNGAELWKSDGTDVGTIMVGEVVAGSGGASITNITPSKKYLFFSANDGVNGKELWAIKPLCSANSTSTFSTSICTSYTSPSGKIYTATGVYNDTISNVAGCDSIITINLTIKKKSGSTINQTACNNYTLNGQVYSSSGTYMQTKTNSEGCDSIITLQLTINTVDASVTQNGNVLTANIAGVTYQWIDCANGNIAIAGATSQSFTATATGTYAAIVTKNGCTDTSACFPVTITGVNENASKIGFIIYPNPSTNGLFTISFRNGLREPIHVIIIDIAGREMYAAKIVDSNTLLNLSQLNKGVYFLNIKDYTSPQKLIIQ